MTVDLEQAQALAEPITKQKKSTKDKGKKTQKEQSEGREQTGDDDEQLEKKKRKKDRKREQDAGETVTPMEVDVAPLAETKKEKKKQKRKREEDASTPSDPGASREKDKDRKKRRKDRSSDPSSSSTPAQHTSAEATPAPSSSETSAYLEKHAIKIHSPGHIGPITPALSFDQLDIPPGLRSAFSTFKEPTPIQTCTWPPALKGHDVVGIAETGSGKTLAFGIPALAQLISSAPSKSKSKSSSANLSVSVLVLAPTRELAIQTHDTLSDLGGKFNIASVALFGGVEKGGQIRTLQNANKDGKTTRIVVGTPGRILDLVNDGICDLSGVSYLVLDEADRMLDKGFENDIRSIISHTKQGEDRQTLMFSATWPEAVRRLASTFQRDPVRVTVGSDDLTANSRVEQVVEVFDDARSKDNRLIAQLRNNKTKADLEESRTLIFALYKKEASRVENMLRGKGYSVGALHGDMSQAARMDALQSFKDGRTRFLVATDVAARGLDIPNVGLVINYTFPLTIEDYIHRIGRTGRGGRSGKSVTFFTGDNHERALAGELARVLHESGFEAEGLKKFPMTIKKKTHSAYGAFFRDDIPAPAAPTKIKF